MFYINVLSWENNITITLKVCKDIGFQTQLDCFYSVCAGMSLSQNVSNPLLTSLQLGTWLTPCLHFRLILFISFVKSKINMIVWNLFKNNRQKGWKHYKECSLNGEHYLVTISRLDQENTDHIVWPRTNLSSSFVVKHFNLNK